VLARDRTTICLLECWSKIDVCRRPGRKGASQILIEKNQKGVGSEDPLAVNWKLTILLLKVKT
jgi:hypothetical protein